MCRELHLVALASSLRVSFMTRTTEAGAMLPTIRTSSWCDDLDRDHCRRAAGDTDVLDSVVDLLADEFANVDFPESHVRSMVQARCV